MAARVIWAYRRSPCGRGRGKNDRSSLRGSGRRPRSSHAERAAHWRQLRPPCRNKLHGEGPVRHKGAQSLQRQSRFLWACDAGTRDRDSELFRKVGHVLLQGATAEAKIERLILAENFFRHTEASMDQALWEAIGKIGS